MLRYSHLLTETVIVSGPPTLMRLNRCDGLDTDLARVCNRAVRVEVERYAHCVSRVLVMFRGLHILTLRGEPRTTHALFECELHHCVDWKFRCGLAGRTESRPRIIGRGSLKGARFRLVTTPHFPTA